MYLRSNNTLILYQLGTLLIICILFTIGIFAACLVDPVADRVLPVLLSGIMWLTCAACIFWDWIVYGREIQLTEEGCIVRFLVFKRMYRWDQMKTKRKIKLTIWYDRYNGSAYKGILLFRKKSRHLQKHLQFFPELPYDISHSLHPFSLIYIFFEPRLNSGPPDPPRRLPDWLKRNWVPEWMKTGKGSGYFADEKQLLSLLESWGVELEGDYRNLLF